MKKKEMMHQLENLRVQIEYREERLANMRETLATLQKDKQEMADQLRLYREREYKEQFKKLLKHKWFSSKLKEDLFNQQFYITGVLGYNISLSLKLKNIIDEDLFYKMNENNMVEMLYLISVNIEKDKEIKRFSK